MFHTSLWPAARAQCHGSSHTGGEHTATCDLGVTSAPAHSRGSMHAMVGPQGCHSGTWCMSLLVALTSTHAETRLQTTVCSMEN